MTEKLNVDFFYGRRRTPHACLSYKLIGECIGQAGIQRPFFFSSNSNIPVKMLASTQYSVTVFLFKM